MLCPMSSLKFVGTISLGLLTGVSYSLTTTTLPSLALLPSARSASQTLLQIQQSSTRQILSLASISQLSLLTVYTLASPRNKHPYLLWTALVSFLGGQGVEYFYNGFSRFPRLTQRNGRRSRTIPETRGGSGSARDNSEDGSGYIEVEASESEINGEKVEMEMSRERKVQGVRSLVAGLGFLMGVVGIWGDGA